MEAFYILLHRVDKLRLVLLNSTPNLAAKKLSDTDPIHLKHKYTPLAEQKGR